MANVRMTVGALLGTVATTANAFTGVVNAGAKSVGMLDTWVDQMADEQKMRAVSHKERAKTRIAIELAQEEAELLSQAREFCDRSSHHAADFNTAHTKYENLLKAL